MANHDPKILLEQLQALFLNHFSPMTIAINNLIKCYRFKLKLEICGFKNPGYLLFIEIVKKLGINFESVDIPVRFGEVPWNWLADKNSGNLRAWIPNMKNREGDFPVMFPFYLNYHLKELRKHDPNFPSPNIDNLYIILLSRTCFGPAEAPLSVRILNDLLFSESTHQLTVPLYEGYISEEMKIMYHKIADLSQPAQLYLGFCLGQEKFRLARTLKEKGHPYCILHLDRWDFQRQNIPEFPPNSIVVKGLNWNIEQMGVMIKNGWTLNNDEDQFLLMAESEKNKILECLMLRLSGLNEDEIMYKLGFPNEEKYCEWQVSQFIDIDPDRFRDPLKSWLEACEYFDLEPNIKILEDHGTLAGDKHKSDSTKIIPQPAKLPPEPPFRHSPDFRSVRAANGQSFTLTEKQAHVILELHKAYENGTPELSQAYLIEEVYGVVSENRLKKLFGNNEIWEALIENGKRKGTYRLKIKRPIAF